MDDDDRGPWIVEAYRRLAFAGHRAGGARTDVIELLAAERGCMTAHEIVSALQAAGRRAAPSSVYRTLSTLRDLRMIRAFDHGEGVLRYELDDPHGRHHHHLVCERCGKTEIFEDERIEDAIEAVADRRRYRIAAHEVVLFGLCGDCVLSGKNDPMYGRPSGSATSDDPE